ncbi:unnamed protein product [Mycena citricolor]|uniref:Ino eighty subunit 1 n=1 Tax=Mycena citricolor TaxID=2018698 RepID=A0AAD2GXE2_9AGAR|nr:unnamed protein product [Mycena citricolor]
MSATSPASASAGPPSWPLPAPEPIPPQVYAWLCASGVIKSCLSNSAGYLSRKALPIKRNDAEALTREDVQYDLLRYIFEDEQAVFHHPTPGKKCCFRELYIHAIYNSSKCSKVLKDKMVETPAFAIELAKISLLTNVGRINTTMACELYIVLSAHPPADRSAFSFPRNIVKTALRTYHPVPCLQKTDGNAQDAPRIKNCLKAALLPSEFKSVPPSTPEDILAKWKAGLRPPTSVVNLIFVLSNHAAPLAAVHFEGLMNFLDLFLPKPQSSLDRARAFLWLMYYYLEGPHKNPYEDDYARRYHGRAPLIRNLLPADAARENVDTDEEREWGITMSSARNTFLTKLIMASESDKKNKPVAAPQFVPSMPDDRFAPRRPKSFIAEMPKEPSTSFMYYVPQSGAAVAHPQSLMPAPVGPIASPAGERSMIDHAWKSIMTYDPLRDSDDESPDEYAQIEYSRRYQVLARLRGHPPNPERPVDDERISLGRFQQVQSWD